jgi:hypothetical protein
MGANLILLLSLAAAPPALAGALSAFMRLSFSQVQTLFYSCPVYSLVHCQDVEFKKSPGHFWYSVGIIFGLTLLLLLMACRTAPRAWQDKPLTARSLKRKGQSRRRWWRQGRAEKAAAFRRRLLALNAYFWLAARPYLKVSYVWTATFLMGAWWAFSTLSVGHIDEAANYAAAFILNTMLKLWITTEAGHQLAEDKRSGAFELLLSTPLTVRDIVHGQWMALGRQFLKPLVAAMFLELVLMVSIRHNRGVEQTQARWVWLAGILMLLADVITLGWFAMSAALTEKTHGHATAKAAAFILAMPWILFGAVAGGTWLWVFLFFRAPWEPDWPYYLGWWFGLGISVDVLLWRSARRQLQTSFRKFALEPPPPKPRLVWLRDLFKGPPEGGAVRRAQRRRLALAAAVALAAVAGVVLWIMQALRFDLPKPVVVALSRSNHPARVFAGRGGFLFFLPDGSLWRWAYSRDMWGRPVISQPQQVGTNRDWVQVSVAKTNAAAVRSDGTLWSWSVPQDQPRQLGSAHDWVEARAGSDFAIARKQNGTLWAWGDNDSGQLGNGPGPGQRQPVQVGTNGDWTAISVGSGRLAVRADGSLWGWGSCLMATGGLWYETNHSAPMRICRETNWIGFSEGVGNRVRNREGQWWSFYPFAGLPDPDTPAAAIGQLVSSNAASATYGLFFDADWTQAMHEARPDGTLWASPISWLPSAPSGPPLRVGRRSDWVAVWSTYETTIGMTSDGTLWTWGLDYGQERHLDFGDRVGVMKDRLSRLFGAMPPPNSIVDWGGFQPQKEPRPLLRMVETNSGASAK